MLSPMAVTPTARPTALAYTLNTNGQAIILASDLHGSVSGLAVLRGRVIGIPLGFLLGRLQILRWALDPLVQILRPVSPLAWLPIGLALLHDAERTAVFVIVLSALWPILLNTVDAVRHIPPPTSG